MIVNINDAKKSWLKNVLLWHFFKTLWLYLAFTKVNKYSQTITAAVDPEVEVDPINTIKIKILGAFNDTVQGTLSV